ncbi:MAG: 16S rRNA (cytosine(1402)-N(4))-methyltransferase RsmH [Woeseiaceae bacterium]|nr:16S rRNA (cytosine(1402)-N(4))-methyltransferase RsmH [Woeseiaceae bacterium]
MKGKDENKHIPVLLNEAITGLNIKKNGIYIDGTFGRGGHSKEILKALDEKGHLFAIDRDLQAIDEIDSEFENDLRFELIKDEMSELKNIVKEKSLSGKIDGVIFDLGVSSPQLDQASRGFSFQKDGPLDMRMDTTKGITAAEWLSSVSEDQLRKVLFQYGEEKFSSRIARNIIKNRNTTSLNTTFDLVNIITQALPKMYFKKHPATKTFQAIRIYINDELSQLESALNASLELLRSGGRLCVISFHSLEDRIVKRFIKNASLESKQYRGLPDVPVEFQPKLKIIGKAVRASIAEIGMNVRSRSAVLRIAERI